MIDTTKFKPMLADKAPDDLSLLHYPVMASIKLDGIRAEYIDSTIKSRSLKKIPNVYINKELRTIFGLRNSEIFDGELLSGKNFQECTSAVMREDGEPSFDYYVFDYLSDTIEEKYEDRMKKLEALDLSSLNNRVRVIKVLPVKCNNKEELLAFEKECLDAGHEGIMIRSCDGPYKLGRSTEKEGYLLKLKRFVDSEMIITSLEELETNNNVKQINELGYTKRASNKANKVGANTLGTIVGTDIKTGVKVRLGTGKGLTKKLRKIIWDNQEEYIGKIVKYKHFVATGVKDKRRIPVFLGFRDKMDMSE